MNKPTLVIGVSTNPDRYSFKAVNALIAHKQTVFAYGLKTGEIAGVSIDTEQTLYKDIHTVSLYVGPQNQSSLYDYIEELKPKRVIFNPGTENEEFQQRLISKKIEVEVACTLVLLATGQY